MTYPMVKAFWDKILPNPDPLRQKSNRLICEII